MFKWDFSDLKDVKSAGNLSPEARRFVFLVAETVDGCKGASCEIVRGLYNDYGGKSHILHNATFLNKTPPDKSPTLGIDTKGWTWQEYLALVYAETYSSEVAGAGAGTILAKVGAKFGSAIVNRIGNVIQSRLGLNKAASLCFVAGTPVLTTEGYKNIEDIRLGDMVISRDEERRMTVVKPVTELFFNRDKEIWSVNLVSDDGQSETFGATAEHPFYVNGKGWVGAAQLKIGDQVANHASGEGQGGFLLVKSVVLEDKRQDTYNFEVADTHTYFVGKLNALVHNTIEQKC
jgi:hypothetical protein